MKDDKVRRGPRLPSDAHPPAPTFPRSHSAAHHQDADGFLQWEEFSGPKGTAPTKDEV
jgi:hypothetical protein